MSVMYSLSPMLCIYIDSSQFALLGLYIALKFKAKELLIQHDIILEELYFRDAENLEEISIDTNKVVILISCFLENIWFIDNIIFEI